MLNEEIVQMLKTINPYEEFDEKTDLIQTEILDSIGIMLLITELEEKYFLKIPLNDLELEDFRTVGNIVQFAGRYIKEHGCDY